MEFNFFIFILYKRIIKYYNIFEPKWPACTSCKAANPDLILIADPNMKYLCFFPKVIGFACDKIEEVD